ncbi:PH domain-containing protein [Streptomonospora sp. S1-112]|uniref:PH domain-containing protein n=1 Tax=Streptomonospora mangrovi TaxID=2883123 RepID=A0A9X3NME4_9ACTN|nr:PH domain-containing protein [Streptomonospora mangrovi]MDA0566419.1 PH domain-containing protein [Streptomonospora mangrovi]
MSGPGPTEPPHEPTPGPSAERPHEPPRKPGAGGPGPEQPGHPPGAAGGPAPDRPEAGERVPDPARPPAETDAPADASGGAPPPEAPAAVPPPEPARRLSALTMVTAPIAYLRNFLVPVVIALVAGTYSVNPWVLGSTGAAIVAMLVGGLVTWRTFRYQVSADRLEIRRGLISRSRRSIPLERIRGVDITATLLHRVLGLAVVRVEAAAGGEASEEGKLDAVTAAEAERLRRVLLHRRAVLRGESAAPAGAPVLAEGAAVAEGAAAGAPGAPAAAPAGTAPGDDGDGDADTETYFTMPLSWYFYAVLSLAYLLTPFAALAAVSGVVSQGLGDAAAERSVQDAGELARDLYLRTSEGGTLLLVLIAVALLLVVLAAMPVFAVVSYAIAHWQFTLRRRGHALVTERGLFTRQSVTLELRRIRGHELWDNPLERLRRVVRLRAVVTGLGQTATRAALLPMGPRATVESVVERALLPFTGPLLRHPRAALGRRLFRAVAPFAAAAAVAAFTAPTWVAVALGVLALLGVPLGVDRYRNLGHGADAHQVSVRSGSLHREQSVVHREAIIGWKWQQSLFQRRTDLVNLQLAVGAGPGGYTAIDADMAESVAFAEGVTPDMVRPFVVREPAADPAPPRG